MRNGCELHHDGSTLYRAVDSVPRGRIVICNRNLLFELFTAETSVPAYNAYVRILLSLCQECNRILLAGWLALSCDRLHLRLDLFVEKSIGKELL